MNNPEPINARMISEIIPSGLFDDSAISFWSLIEKVAHIVVLLEATTDYKPQAVYRKWGFS
jgi:hypothetical protein